MHSLIFFFYSVNSFVCCFVFFSTKTHTDVCTTGAMDMEPSRSCLSLRGRSLINNSIMFFFHRAGSAPREHAATKQAHSGNYLSLYAALLCLGLSTMSLKHRRPYSKTEQIWHQAPRFLRLQNLIKVSLLGHSTSDVLTCIS